MTGRLRGEMLRRVLPPGCSQDSLLTPQVHRWPVQRCSACGAPEGAPGQCEVGVRQRGAVEGSSRMRRIRVGLFDVGAAVLVLIVLVMPDRALHVGTGYRYVEASALPAVLDDVAQAQADLERDP